MALTEKDLEELYDVITFVIEIENEFPEYADEVYENLGWDFHFKKSILNKIRRKLLFKIPFIESKVRPGV